MTRKLDLFGQALCRLEEAVLANPQDALSRDGAIQRFEFTCELAWKAIQEQLFAREGLEVKSPRQALRQAFVMGWIEDEEIWLALLEDRNQTSHTYNQDLADLIFTHLSRYAVSFRKLHTRLIGAELPS